MAEGTNSPLQRRQSAALIFSNENISYDKVLSVIFGKLGVETDTVLGIQFMKVNRVIIKFVSDPPFRVFLEKYEGRVAPVPASAGGGTVKVVNFSQNLTLVTVKNAPFEMSNEAVTNAFKRYGRVLSIKKHVHTHEQAQGIQTGTRTLKMELKHKIPPSLTVSGYSLSVLYNEQRKACSRCTSEEHFTQDCSSGVRGGKSVFYDVGFDHHHHQQQQQQQPGRG